MRRRGRTSVPVLEDSDQGRERHRWYQQKVASRRQFEDRFQSLAKEIFDAAFECQINQDGARIGTALTEVLLSLTGFSKADRARYESWERLVHPDDHSVVATHSQRVLGGQRDVCVFRVITRLGAACWFGVLMRPVWGEAGWRLAHVYGLVRDLSAYTEAEATPARRDADPTGASGLISQRAIF